MDYEKMNAMEIASKLLGFYVEIEGTVITTDEDFYHVNDGTMSYRIKANQPKTNKIAKKIRVKGKAVWTDRDGITIFPKENIKDVF